MSIDKRERRALLEHFEGSAYSDHSLGDALAVVHKTTDSLALAGMEAEFAVDERVRGRTCLVSGSPHGNQRLMRKAAQVVELHRNHSDGFRARNRNTRAHPISKPSRSTRFTPGRTKGMMRPLVAVINSVRPGP